MYTRNFSMTTSQILTLPCHAGLSNNLTNDTSLATLILCSFRASVFSSSVCQFTQCDIIRAFPIKNIAEKRTAKEKQIWHTLSE